MMGLVPNSHVHTVKSSHVVRSSFLVKDASDAAGTKRNRLATIELPMAAAASGEWSRILARG